MSDTTPTIIDPALRAAIQLAMSKAPRCDEVCLAPIRAFPLLEVVKGMETELTSKEPKTGPLALQVLAFAAIERKESEAAANNTSLLPTSEALETLFSFLVTKINHFTTIDSAVDAVARVFVWYGEHHPKLVTTPAILKAVINNMLSKISVPSMFGNSKASAFALIKAILKEEVSGCFSKDQTKSFLEAFLQSVDGERDPTYVLDVFTMSYSIFTSFSVATLQHYTEDFFMTLSNYFPVLFNPPPRCTVTKEELKHALTEVLILPVFEEVCIPFVLSKLSSPAEVAKVDSLGLLHEIFSRVGSCTTAASAPSYAPCALASHLADVLGSLRGEAIKLAASVTYNPSAKDLLKLVMSVTEDVGRVLDILGGGKGRRAAGSNASSNNKNAAAEKEKEEENDNAAPSSSSASPSSSSAAPVVITKEARDAVLSHCDRTLTACLGTIDAGSDSRAYAMLLNSLMRGGGVVASILSGYVLPMVGIRLLGVSCAAVGAFPLQPSSGGGEDDKTNKARLEQEERIYMSTVAVLGGVFSALEMLKNGGEGGCNDIAIVIKPQTTQCIVDALLGCVVDGAAASASCPHPLEDALPLIVEVISTFIAIRDVLPGGAEAADQSDSSVPSSAAIIRSLLKRACAAHTAADSVSITMKSIANVSRVATDTVLEAVLGKADGSASPLYYELAASPRLPLFFTQLHGAVGATNAKVRAAVLDALLLGNNTPTAIATAIDIFGFTHPAMDSYLHALALYAASEAAATTASSEGDDANNTNSRVSLIIDNLLRLSIPEQCNAGADLLCELLGRCPSAQAGLLAVGSGEDDTATKKPSMLSTLIEKKTLTSWLCAVASASKEAVERHYSPSSSWVDTCLGVIGAASFSPQVKSLALRAIASIANKGAADVVSSSTFEAAIDRFIPSSPNNADSTNTTTNNSSAIMLLSEGDKASVRAAVCKGLLARGGADPLETLAPLLSAVKGYGSAGVGIGGGGESGDASSHTCQLLVAAFGQLISPPFPSSASSPSSSSNTAGLWLQKAYVTIVDALLVDVKTPLALLVLTELIKKAPLKLVAATSGDLVEKLGKVLDASNTLVVSGNENKASHTTTTPNAFITSPSTAAVLSLATLLDRATCVPATTSNSSPHHHHHHHQVSAVPVEVMRSACLLMLTYSEASKGLYGMVYGNANATGSSPQKGGGGSRLHPLLPLVVREVLASALLTIHTVVVALAEGSGAQQQQQGGVGKVVPKKNASEDPLKAFAKEAKVAWVLPWLKVALDDPKRPIRAIAAKSSHEWHRLN